MNKDILKRVVSSVGALKRALTRPVKVELEIGEIRYVGYLHSIKEIFVLCEVGDEERSTSEEWINIEKLLAALN